MDALKIKGPLSTIPKPDARFAARYTPALHFARDASSVMKYQSKINIIAIIASGFLVAGALADGTEPAKQGASPGAPGTQPPKAPEPGRPAPDRPAAPQIPRSPQTPGTPDNTGGASAAPKNPEAPAK
jgi:hypothetical protein